MGILHSHGHDGLITSRLRLAIAVTVAVLVAEVIGGVLANSLALLSDAGHVVTDVFALALSWFGVRQAQRAAGHRMTFGYHRVGIFIALVNAVTLVVIAGLVFFEAFQRLRAPEPVDSVFMLAVATGGLVGNLTIMFLLGEASSENLNVRSALLHVLGDALSSVGTIVGGLLILLTGTYWIDPAISVFIALIIVAGSWQISRDALRIFLEATPEHIDLAELVRAVQRIPTVQDMHDLHVWTIAPNLYALSCHLLVDDMPISEGGALIDQVNDLLRDRFRIGHTAIQLESVACEPGSLYCRLTPHHEPGVHL